jgi:hypothetical protein
MHADFDFENLGCYITSVTTSPYPFYFVFVPRIASNRKKVRFGEVAIPKQISVLRCKKS